MRVHYPLTIIAAVGTFGFGILSLAWGQMQTFQTTVASSWPVFIKDHFLAVMPFVLVVTVIAWLIERRLHRSRTAA
jgi:ABC-type uncharacterized transport system permease subunit